MTALTTIYDSFLDSITDDMYMELTKSETESLLFSLFQNALPWFEFPRFDVYNFDTDLMEYNCTLTREEIKIISTYMIVEWLGQQLASVEVARMKYSGSDFKFTSQANHMHKLKDLQKEYERKGFHLQRLYKRRKVDRNGIMRSTFGSIMEPPSYEINSNNEATVIQKLSQDVKELQHTVGYQSDKDLSNDEEIVISGGSAPIEGE